MGNGAPTADAGQRVKQVRSNGSSGDASSVDVNARTFDADARAKVREETPVVVDGHSYVRRRKTWKVSRQMRRLMRDQESAIATSTRVRRRVVELEVEQMEAASKGEDETEAKLEQQITDLIGKADEATEAAEAVTYRLLCVLLIPAEGDASPLLDAQGEPDEGAVERFMDTLDVEDAADLARELSGSTEEDPPTTQETAATSA